ncbi:helix-turn-helix domain-containing protein [Kerstersia gyiorum]|uniref:helix-turn-helix domain-containing protein n=1 Tax=Kerstersia gyiorum TaxID=206506 RepID=UPI0039EB7EDF
MSYVLTMVEYKDRLSAAMKRAGVSTQKLADKLGVSYQAVKKVEDGRSNALSAPNNAHAARFLGVRSDWLAIGDGAMTEGGDAAEKAKDPKDGWPFPRLSPDDYAELSESQRAAIEDWVIGQVRSFRSSAPVKSGSNGKAA